MDLVGREAKHRRHAAFRHGQHSLVDPWIAQALEEVKAGDPGRALFLGRELHWMDRPEWHATSAELLIRAYSALGRRTHAEIIRAHLEKFGERTLRRQPGRLIAPRSPVSNG